MNALQFLAWTLVAFVVIAGVIGIAATMLSSRISREEEEMRR